MTPRSDKIEYRATIKKFGNSKCVPVPAYILKEYGIDVGTKVNIVIVPIEE